MRVAIPSSRSARASVALRPATLTLCAELAFFCGLLMACDVASKNQPRSQRSEQATEREVEDEPIGYSSGEWWQDERLNALLLNASQIVISYAGAQSGGTPVPFVPPRRTKDAALALARSLRGELRSDAAKFAALAKKYSDEPVSAALGGALGNFHAPTMPREIVDALQQLKVGEVSRIVETEQGYHLLLRRDVVTQGKLAFAHLVVKHTGANGFRREDRPVAALTRDQARSLAQQLAARAVQQPNTFAALVQTYSDAEDALRAGDMGRWPRGELLDGEFLLFEVASRLAIGAVSGVVETASGFHILKRSSEQDRQELAMSAITILHDGSQFYRVDPRATRTKEEALRSARELLAQLKARPARFAQWQRERCEIAFCDGVHTFEEGRGPPALERALRKIEVGALAHAPVETPFGIVLVRREDPLAPHILQAKAGANGSNAASSQAASRRSARVRARAKHGATVAVQSPDAARKAPERFADNLRRFERYAFGKMRLSRPERTEVTSILDAFAHAVLEGGDRDLQADAQRADERLAQLLGPSKHEELTRHRAAFFSEQAP